MVIDQILCGRFQTGSSGCSGGCRTGRLLLENRTCLLHSVISEQEHQGGQSAWTVREGWELIQWRGWMAQSGVYQQQVFTFSRPIGRLWKRRQRCVSGRAWRTRTRCSSTRCYLSGSSTRLRSFWSTTANGRANISGGLHDRCIIGTADNRL